MKSEINENLKEAQNIIKKCIDSHIELFFFNDNQELNNMVAAYNLLTDILIKSEKQTTQCYNINFLSEDLKRA